MDIPYDLTCWYINARRIIELTGVDSVFSRSIANWNAGDHLQKLAEIAALKDAAVDWLQVEKPSSLGMLITENRLNEGQLFTHNSNFWFKGLSSVSARYRQEKEFNQPIGYAKLPEWREKGRVLFEFHPDHLTSNSSWSSLSGQARKFVLGAISEIRESTIYAILYLIANVVHNRSEFWSREQQYWSNHLEIHVDQIDTFAEVEKVDLPLTKRTLNQLKSIPEDSVKSAFAEIIGEPRIPKDWGGEKSDLFSTYVRLNGRRISTAFALKGPSKFKPMTSAELGKNGDQINRLFDEPADLYVLQHCHEISNDVRRTMRAYAEQMGRPRLFCLIDGYDTVRVLSAYRKCGLKP